jgi:hypothetical protein
MMIPADWWPRLHGASTHLPVALVPVAALFEALSLIARDPEWRKRLGATSALLLPLAAFGSIASVVSGLGQSHGEWLGQGLLRSHHLFVWPAFALLIGLATWRLLAGPEPSALAKLIYRVALWINAGLILAAAYWGGELALSH